MFNNLGHLSLVGWGMMADLLNCVQEQQLHFMVLILLKTLEKFHTYNRTATPPKHPDVCFLCVSASLLENELNKGGIV